MSDIFRTMLIDDLLVLWSRALPRKDKDLDSITLKDDSEIGATGLMQNLLKEVNLPGEYGPPSHDYETWKEISIQYDITGKSEERVLLNNEGSKNLPEGKPVSVFYKRAIPSHKLTYDDFVRLGYDLKANELSAFHGQKWARTENWTNPKEPESLTLGFTAAYWVAPADLPLLGQKINEIHNFFESIDR